MTVLEQSNAVCKSCKEPLEAGWSRCPSCGSATSSGAALACPNCGRMVKENWRNCPDCQTPLGGERTPSGTSGLGQERSPGPTRKKQPRIFVTGDEDQPNKPGDLPNLTGKKLGERYMIQDHLGTGGFGAVYAAFDEVTNQKTALKIVVVPNDTEQSQHAAEQVLQEYKLRQKINDFTHVIKCDDPRACDLNGLSLILLPMELAPDGSFRRWLQANPDKNKRRAKAMAFFRQACLGVKAIHNAEQAHLDLKPENILIKDGRAKITDFGIGRFASLAAECDPEQLVRAGMGTPRYMSPEQFEAARQQDVGASSDIYSLGVILFEILDGNPPFDGSRSELQRRHQTVTPSTLKGTAAPWARVVERCLAKAPDQRYDSVEALISDLDRVEQGAATSVDVACPKCGRINSNPEHKICANCQTSLAKHFLPCPTCAKEVRLDVETCTGCGAAVLAYRVRQQRWNLVEQLKDEDPVEAISILERMLRDDAKELKDRCVAELRRLRENQATISDLITAADRAAAAGQFEVVLGAWQDVLKLAPRHRVGTEKARSIEKLLSEFRAHQSQGLSLLDRADFDRGTRCLHRCIELIPQSTEVKNQLQDVHRRASVYTTAMQQACSCRDAKRFTAALAHLRDAIQEAPQSADALDLRAKIESTIEETDGLLKLVRQSMNRGLFEDAEKNLEAVEHRRADVNDLERIKIDLRKQKESYAQAMMECDRAIGTRDLGTALEKAQLALKTCPESSRTQATLKKIRDDQDGASRHLQKSKSLLLAADFRGSAQELEYARGLWSTMPGLNEAGVNIKSTQSAYERHLADAKPALARKAYDEGRAACERALSVCPKSQEVEPLRGQIEEAERAEARRAAIKAEQRQSRRDQIRTIAWVLLILLAGVVLVVALAWMGSVAWRWIKGMNWSRLGDHNEALLEGWGVLLFITACVHQVRYTDLYKAVFTNVFDLRSNRKGAACLVVGLLLALVCGLPSAGAFYLAENYLEMTRPAAITLGAMCGVLIQVVPLNAVNQLWGW